MNLGTGYKNNQACAQFIAKVKQQNLMQVLSKAHYFSLQADSSTDSATIEEELYFDSNGADGKVHVRDVFAINQPQSADALDLYACFQQALQYVGIDDWKTK